MKKNPKIKAPVQVKKEPKSGPVSFQEKLVKSFKLNNLKKNPVAFPVEPRGSLNMTYTKLTSDRSGSWSWGQERKWSKEVWECTIFPHLRECKKKNWFEIENELSGRHKRNKAYEIHRICNEAQERLIYLELEDLDEVFRFRVAYKQRLYGFRVSNLFCILWWDPDHNIYPLSRD